jgi:hypothetical protein
MGRWLDALAELAEHEKNMEIPPGDHPQNPRNPPSPGAARGKNTRMAPAGYPQNPQNRGEAAARAASTPRGYTKAEIEAARRDAARLGYGINRKLH